MSRHAALASLSLLLLLILTSCQSKPVDIRLDLPSSFERGYTGSELGFALVPEFEGKKNRGGYYEGTGMDPIIGLSTIEVPSLATEDQVLDRIKQEIDSLASEKRASVSFRGKESVELSGGFSGALGEWQVSGGSSEIYKYILIVCGGGQCVMADSAALDPSNHELIGDAMRNAEIRALD